MAGLRIVDGETMLAAKLMDDRVHGFCLRPDTSGDYMRLGVVEGATPRAEIVVAQPLLWDSVDLRVLGGKLLVKRLNSRMRLCVRKIA